VSRRALASAATAQSVVRSKLLIRENFVREVVNHDGAVKVRDRRIGTVLLPYEPPPALGVHRLSFSAGAPEIDSAGCAPVLRQDIALPTKAGYALIFRSRGQENASCLLPCDRL